MSIRYEWATERSDEHGDIIDCRQFDTLADAQADASGIDPDGFTVEIVLVRDVGDDVDGLTDRQWAYLEDGKLPEAFSEGARIPKRFFEEAA